MPPNILTVSLVPQIKKSLSTPLLTPLLADRRIGLVIVGLAAAHTGLVILGLPSWPCPVRQVLGIPCPGCGLSRAIAALLWGDWQGSLIYHAFAPFFILALALIAIAAFLPVSPKNWLINQIDVIERQTGITAILLLGLVLYWVARLLILRAAFVNLIAG